ncbi:chromate efflux transporter [Taklimakanibacter deserti]|uniref:chromate efflux transporter n=1 Tax=Taklimakanibacter deserti TaxID=2267839 RepID=UPI0034D71C1A
MADQQAEAVNGLQVEQAGRPSFAETFRTWAEIGLLSFGGPAGQIALMHRVLVDEKKWLDEKRYLAALNFCMLLPGPEAMQLATYAGWTLHGWRGGLAAGTLFVLPGAVVVLVLSMIYAAFGQVPFVAALFFGIKAAVLAIVIEALLRVARRALKFTSDWWIATAAFVALYIFQIPFPLIILIAALIGFFRATPATEPAAPAVAVDWRSTLATTALWLALWLVPLALIIMGFGWNHVFAQTALFFSKLAIVTFGGAYAVLSYMAQQAVETFGWLKADEMIDGLGLAETTPGPLILVTEFVGYMAGYRFAGGLWGGIAAAVITIWMTFVPCFLWIMAGAPYIERLQNMPRLSGALAAVTAAVVGVILNLTVWFALHVLFGTLDRTPFGLVPQFESLDVPALILSAIAATALFAFHQGIFRTLLLCSLLGVIWKTLF